MKYIVPVLLIVIATACAQQEQRATEQTTAQQTASAGQAPPPSASVHEQTIQVGAAFTPASLTIPANQPMRLHFRRTEEATCADEIVIPELNMRKKVAANETVTFDLPAQQARTLNFACGMDMMKGTVVVQ
ncbi:MAG: cupredoxin domain-containing protein [Acidobacteriota bacterium]|nr:cupredoxin domain-containing protein [Acidobacteriota bacterium]